MQIYLKNGYENRGAAYFGKKSVIARSCGSQPARGRGTLSRLPFHCRFWVEKRTRCAGLYLSL